jgi:O-antigen ligase
MGPIDFDCEFETTTPRDDPGEFRGGIWPASPTFWLAAVYLSLFIIRPWELMFPWLQAVRFERVYAVGMIAIVLLGGRPTPSPGVQGLAVLGFLAAMAFSGLCAVDPSLSWGCVFEYLKLVVFYAVLVSVVRNPYELLFMIAWYVATMAAYLAKAQFDFHVFGRHEFRQGVVRLIGVETAFGGPNELAASVVMTFPMVLTLYEARAEFTGDWPDALRRWFARGLALYLVLAVSSVMLTNSRAGMMSSALFAVLAVLRGRGLGRKAVYLSGAVVLLLAVWSVTPATIQDRLRTVWDPASGEKSGARSSAEGRWVGFQAGLEMFNRFPLTGVGVGNFLNYRVTELDGKPLQSHTLVGQLLGESGIIGAANFSALVLATLASIRAVPQHAGEGLGRWARSCVGVATACRETVVLLFFEGLSGHNIYRFNWLWVAAFAALNARFFRENAAADDGDDDGWDD